MQKIKRMLCLVLCFVMVFGMMPVVSLAAESDDALTAALNEAMGYINSITLNNSKNDPETVVRNFGTQFTWDNEKRESNNKGYLFDWSYYNGVVFEGIEYLYEVTGDTKYMDYVVEYMSSLIASNGSWATCTNDSSKQCAGYNSTHGADCYKTASLLLDAYAMTGDSRYLTVAEKLYADLDTAAKSYLLPNAGNNFHHTWASASTPPLWLDGLYMILPFRAEYAKHIGDTEELDLIVSRMQWVSDNMYNSDRGLFYHAATSANSNSGTYWLRSIGWYAAAIVDIMDSMEGDNLESMKTQLVKLVNGMRACQNASNGMWLNNMAANQSSSNPYETSGTALVCYAVLKAVNNGWLDESYADMALLAFKGICTEKLSNNNLTDICFKGAPGSSNSTFYDNEGKGLGPFIMFTAEVQEYVNRKAQEPEVPETTAPQETEVPETTVPQETEPEEDVPSQTVVADGCTVQISGVSGELTGAALSDGDKALLDAKGYKTYMALDVNGTVAEGETAVVTFPIPTGWDTDRIVGVHIENGAVVEIPGTVSDGKFTFEVTHFSGVGIALPADDNRVSDTGNLVSGVEVLGTSVDTLSQGTYYISLTVGGKTLTGTADGTTFVIDGTVELSNTNRWYITSAGTNEYYYIQYGGPTGQYLSLGINATANNTDGTCGAELVDTPTALRVRYVTGNDNGNYSCWVISRTVNNREYYLNDVGNNHNSAQGYYRNGWTAGTNPGNRWVLTPVQSYDFYYELDTDGVDAGEDYLIVNTGNNGTGNVLRNNNGSPANTSLTIDDQKIYVSDDTNLAWRFSGSTSGSVSNNGRYVNPQWNSLNLATTSTNLTISNQGNGAYRIYRSDNSYYYYLRYNNGWTGTRTNRQNSIGTVYLYRKVQTGNGEAVTFTITPGSATLAPGDTQDLRGTVTVADQTVDLGNCNITWTSGNSDVATVDQNGKVIANSNIAADTTVDITATLNSVEGKALATPITLTVPVTVRVQNFDFTIEPESLTLTPDSPEAVLNSKVTERGETVDLNKCDIAWDYDESVITIVNGTVTALDTVIEDTTVTVTATLNSVDGTDLFQPITQAVQVTVDVPDVTFGIEPESLTLTLDSPEAVLNSTVTARGESVDLGKYEITWEYDESVISIVDGTVTVLDTVIEDTTVIVTATLNSIDGTDLKNPITLSVPVTVDVPDVTFAVEPESLTLTFNSPEAVLSSMVTARGETVDLSGCDITWEYDESVVTIVDGTVTALDTVTKDTTVTVTATLNSINGKVLLTPISVPVKVNVDCPEVTFSTSNDDVATKIASVSMKVNASQTLTPYVTFDGTPVSLADCTIEWKTSDGNIATVNNGIVNSKALGYTEVTAILTAVKGYTLPNPIELTYHTTVVEKVVVSAELTGNDPVTTSLGVEPDFSKIKLNVVYDDGTTDEITTLNGLVISGYDITQFGSRYATISYNGLEYGRVQVTVPGDPYAGLQDATKYPTYPENGAVRIDKYATEKDFESTGVVEVELDVAGVSVKTGVDVILVVDVSNSMAWSLDDAGLSEDAEKIADAGEINKLQHAMDAASDFADILLADNTGNIASDNTLSFVTFAGYDSTFGKDSKDADVVDSLMEVFQRETSAGDAKVAFNGTKFKVGVTTYTLTITDTNGNPLVNGTNRGDTNYDYAFWQAHQTAQSIKQINEANDQGDRQVFVVFMTDGAPSHYNGNNKSGSGGRDDRLPDNQNTSYKRDNNYDNSKDTWYEYFSTNHNTYGQALYNEVGGNMFAIGFDLAHGGYSGWQWTEDELVAALKQSAHADNEIPVYAATNESQLQIIYNELATQIKLAGTQANVTDEINSEFTLQMGNFSGTAGVGSGQVNLSGHGITPTITIKTYDLWTKADTTDTTLIGNRKDIEPQVIETVTFNANGTEAYSDQVNSGKKNIMTLVGDDVFIDAKYFTYSNIDGVETFRWKIGDITDKEIALNYFAYLKGSMEGKEPDGLKYTNEEATLEYIDINDKHATQTFPLPAVAWGGASTAYEFYLVNDDGQPCDRNGNTVPFANRITISGPYFEELYLNQSDENSAKEIVASKVLPAGYTLYDSTAKYTVKTSSSNNGSLEISAPSEPDLAQTTILVSYVAESYIQSRVAFGVKYNEIPADSTFLITPDAIVIDYGKEIIIDVKANDKDIPKDVTATLVGFSKFYDNIDPQKQFSSTSASTPFEGTYGTFTVTDDQKVSYVPHKMISSVGKIFCVFRLTKGRDTYYMVSELYVIPATIMYYETDFATGVFNTSVNTTSSGEAWGTIVDTVEADGPQDDGTIGQNTYGYDASYKNDAYLSNHQSLFAEGQGLNKTVATFSFTGTGFDLISRTGDLQGMIKVQIYTSSNMSLAAYKTVSVLNKSESNLELYQIPVVSVNDLPHGTYYVKIGVDVSFENNTGVPALDALERGNQFYFDAVRIYDPAEGNEIAERAYNEDGEADNILVEVRQELISANTFNSLDKEDTEGMVFVDNQYSGDVGADGTPVPGVMGDVYIADYTTIGPNNEVYLRNNQAIAFMAKADTAPASFDIGAKSITGYSAKLQVTIQSVAPPNQSWSMEMDIASSTVQFIDLFEATGADPAMLRTGVYVIITNSTSNVLSITDLKTAFSNVAAVADVHGPRAAMDQHSGDSVDITAASAMTTNAGTPYAVSYTVDTSILDVVQKVLTEPAKPDVPEKPTTPEKPKPVKPKPVQPEEPAKPGKPEKPGKGEEEKPDTGKYEILEVSLKINGSEKNPKYTFTVITSQDVEHIHIFQGTNELHPSKINHKDHKKDGVREWTIVVTNGVSDKIKTFTLIGTGKNGVRGEAITTAKPMKQEGVN